jgi:hypothetical protein
MNRFQVLRILADMPLCQCIHDPGKDHGFRLAQNIQKTSFMSGVHPSPFACVLPKLYCGISAARDKEMLESGNGDFEKRDRAFGNLNRIALFRVRRWLS